MIVVEKLLDRNFTKKQLLILDKCLEETQERTWTMPEIKKRGTCLDFTFEDLRQKTGVCERYTFKKGMTQSDLATFIVLHGRLPKEYECDLLIEKERNGIDRS